MRAEVDQAKRSVVHSKKASHLRKDCNGDRIDELQMYAIGDYIASAGVDQLKKLGAEFVPAVDVDL